MNLYLVERTDNWGYDEYDSWVVAAKSKKGAAKKGPYSNLPPVDITYLGKAAASIDPDEPFIIASFNAG